jgi:hypothetical protein
LFQIPQQFKGMYSATLGTNQTGSNKLSSKDPAECMKKWGDYLPDKHEGGHVTVKVQVWRKAHLMGHFISELV